MEKFKCVECGAVEVDHEDDMCDDCFDSYNEFDEDLEGDEDDN